MFILRLYDRNGLELNEGDIVSVSDGHRIQFFAEVKYLEKEQVITPFHTFSFNSFKKVDKLPDGVIKASEERYNVWYLNDVIEDESFEDYLAGWRQCEHHLEKRCWRIEKNGKQLTLF
jgi:hypothetical protein